MLRSPKLVLDELVEDGPILIAEAWNLTPHLETGLEIAARLAFSGVNVDYLFYGHKLPANEGYNRPHRVSPFGFNLPIRSPEQFGIALLIEIKRKFNLPINIVECPVPISSLKLDEVLPNHVLDSVDSLKQAKYLDSSSFGLSIASSLISTFRDACIRPIDHKQYCLSLAVSYIYAFHFVSDLIKMNKYQSVVLFNGRFSSLKGAVEAARAHSLKVYYHERGANMKKFFFKPYQPHDLNRIQGDVLRVWNEAQLKFGDSAVLIAKQFFEDQSRAIEQGWESFVAHQEIKAAEPFLKMAQVLSLSGKVVVYFSSSIDEWAASGYTYDLSFGSQIEAVTALYSACKYNSHSLIIRIHPNQPVSEGVLWNKLELLEDLVIIPSHSKASSYYLMQCSDVVATYGSTVGVESVYWGKPSILLNSSLYSNIGVSVVFPRDLDELTQILASIDSIPVDSVTSYKYGFYFKTNGVDFIFYQPESLFSGRFYGFDLQYNFAQEYFNMIIRLKSFVKRMRCRLISRFGFV